MAKISTYVINASPSLSDKLIGTDVDDLSITKNFTLADIADLFQTYLPAPTLEQVVTSGGTSTLPISLTTLTPSTITLLSIPRIDANQVAFSDSSGILDGVSSFKYISSTSTLIVTNLSANSAVIYNGFRVVDGFAEFYSPVTLDDQLIDGLGSPGTSGQVLKSTGSGTIWETYMPTTIQVLSAESTLVGQAPAAVDTPLQVRFDGPVSNAYVTLDALGVITFLQTGFYMVNVQGLFKRVGSSGGTAKVHFRGLVNGTQMGPTQAVDIDVVGVGIPYERSMPLNVTSIGTTLTFEIVRDSAGTNAGGLYQENTTLAGWGDVPSAAILINKIV